MYRFLLAWRYLRTRYIALASIVSVTLGVGTLIVVNSVMAGFTKEMHVRLHGILADIVFESQSLDGFVNVDAYKEEIRKIVGADLAGMTSAVHVPAMLNFQIRGQWITKQMSVVGVDEETYADVSDFRQYLIHPTNKQKLSFLLHEDGYGDDQHPMPPSGWKFRRLRVQYEREFQAQREEMRRIEAAQNGQAAGASEGDIPAPPDTGIPTAPLANNVPAFDEAKDQYTGIILGIAIGSVKQRNKEGKVQDFYLVRPGDDVKVTFPSSGTPPKAITDTFTVTDFYESKMSEYDSSFAFVPLRRLQEMRGMIDPTSGQGAVTTIQLRLKPGADLNAVRDRLRARFPAETSPFSIQTWRDMQGPLLAAVQMETTLLNILLFLIIAVAGFGILATFFMIVVEKTKDIGVLKALGASSRGVMSIFLGYGVSLGMVGSGVGVIGGLLFVIYINDIAALIEYLTGHEVFDPTVYYFSKIPTVIDPLTVVGVVCGAVLIAVMAAVLPAIRAARLHPVQALRYE